MKVTTDGCLFGAWVANEVKSGSQEPTRLLDIGTGTGLLALMLAQVTRNTQIDAIEVNASAFSEATENFANSQWAKRLHCRHSRVQDHLLDDPYEVVISNPPFFSKNQKGQHVGKNQALHSDLLPMSELAQSISSLLAKDGEAYVLYPEREMYDFVRCLKKEGLFLSKRVEIRNRVGAPIFRIIGGFSRIAQSSQTHTLTIKDSKNNYCLEFSQLLEGYYLN